MRPGLFPRIFILFGAILLLALLATELLVTRTVRADKVSLLRDNLAVQARLIADALPPGGGARLDGHARRLKAETAARITIIAPDGGVLGDSDHASATMDNHQDRVEVRQAVLSGTGMAVRRSETLNADLLYVAVRSDRSGGLQGFVRLSVPLTEIERSINRLRVRLFAGISGILAFAAGLPAFQIERLRRLTVQVRDFATSIARGDLGRRLFLRNAGEFEEIAGSLNNMAASLQTEVRSLQEEKAKFETALLGISDGVLLLDRQGRVKLANRAFLDLFGIREEIGGRPFIEVVRNHALADIVRGAHELHRPSSAEINVAVPKQLTLLATALPIIEESSAEDRFRGSVVALHDITQLKKLEQVRKDFVANVSHELRTPITAIQGFAETLLAGALDDRGNALRFIETIRANSRRINALVEDLMTISRIELGAVSVDKTDVAFEDVADAVIALLREKAAARGLALSADIPHDLGTVRADRDRLLQVLTNLVDNAIKFTEKGSVVIGAREENGRIVLFVEDTGIGVAEKHLARLGERFYRVDAARSRSMGGTGLGLAIVKHLVKAHGWEMKIESRLGKGTTVRIMVS